MWKTRGSSIRALDNELKSESTNIYQMFSLVDEVIDIFQREWQSSAFTRVTGLVFTKGINLARGIFSLSLDGLAQEAGALLRPLIESIELLTYFRLDPERVNKILDNNLKTPSAGEIAKKIEGQYKELREYLNKYASHFSIGPESMFHLIDLQNDKIIKVQPFSKNVLKRNVITVNVFLIFIVHEAISCLLLQGINVPSDLVWRFELLREKTVIQWEVE